MGENLRVLRFKVIVCLMILYNVQANDTTLITKNPIIVIIGAGPAGIAAASKLFENNFKNVTILEAEDRIGGRVYTTQFGNYSVDLGGQWVDGEKGNVVFELAYPLGLLDKSDEPNYGLVQEYVDSLGNPIGNEFEKKLADFFFEYVYEPDLSNVTAYESVGEYVEKMFDRQFNNIPEIFNDKKKYLQHLELFTIGEVSAESWYNISIFGNEQYKECLGDRLINWKDRGYSTILNVLMKRYLHPEEELPVMKNTILNSEVLKIDHSKNNEEFPVLITTATGQSYKADHVIVTVSLGVLKDRHKTLFVPPLPDYKSKTIKGLGFGNLAKIYLLFEQPFWQLGNRRILHWTFIWNDIQRKAIEDYPDKMWLLGITGAMTVQHKPNILELWIAGKYAKIMETLSEDIVYNHTVENLYRFLDKKYKVTKPIKLLRTQWFSNPHFKGTYSYRSIEAHKAKVYPAMLEAPLGLQNMTILFAGEATSTNRFATVDGAIESGWKAADRLIKHYENLLTKNLSIYTWQTFNL